MVGLVPDRGPGALFRGAPDLPAPASTEENDMRNSVLLLAALSCAALTGCTSSTGSDGRGSDSFSRNTIGEYQVFTDRGGTWTIANGALTGRDAALHNVLVRKGTRMSTGWVEARSDTASDGGLVIRFADNANYVLLAFRDDASSGQFYGNNLALYARIGGFFQEIANANVSWPQGTMHTIRLEAGDGKLRMYFDGALQRTATMPAGIPAEGLVGVRHFGEVLGWITRIDELRWDLDR
jgi:hypothetical protein